MKFAERVGFQCSPSPQSPRILLSMVNVVVKELTYQHALQEQDSSVAHVSTGLSLLRDGM